MSAAAGQNLLRGYQLCVKHLNDKGGVLGRTLELLVHDDASDPATADRLYERLITQDKVDLVLGPFISTIVDPVANVTEKHKMPMVVPGGAASIYRKRTARRSSSGPRSWRRGKRASRRRRGVSASEQGREGLRGRRPGGAGGGA